MGVAVVVAVDIANFSARTAFRLSVERVAGQATHEIVGAAGSVPEAVYAALRLQGRLRRATPIIEGSVRIGRRTFTLLGIDPVASAALRQPREQAALADLPTLLTKPGALLLGEVDARSLGVEAGSRLHLEVGERQYSGVVAGIVRGDRTALDGLAIADIATAQELLGRPGVVDRIDLVLGQGQAGTVAAALPPGLRLVPTERRRGALDKLTRAFRTNLTAMSLLALLVGGFLIYNTMTFAVLRRRPLLGTLRTLGATRSQLFGLVLTEALVLALVGGVIGISAGIAAGWGLVQLVARTINDLYFTLTVSQLFVSPWSLIKGVGMGLVTTLVAALPPAAEAAAAQPRDVLRRNRIEQEARRLLPWVTFGGAALMLVGLSLLQVPSRSIWVGFVALFAVIIGFSLCVPIMARGLVSLVTPVLGCIAGPHGRLAGRSVAGSISRTGIAVAALTVAVSASIGVGIMIQSLRGSVAEWLTNTLSSDLYVSVPDSSTGVSGRLSPQLADALVSVPGIAEVSKGRRVRVETSSGPVTLLALESSSRSHQGFRLVGKPAQNLWPRFEAGELILISEPYSYHQRLSAGDNLLLFTARGWRRFEIGGIFADYGSDKGMLVMERHLYAHLWSDPTVSTMGVVLAPGAAIRSALQQVRTLVDRYGTGIQVRANRTIREESLAVFDRTFVITRVLRTLALGVAFVGVLSALMALQLERARDYATLRAIGFSPGQLVVLILLQTSVMGLAAGVLALPLGWMMGGILVDVINVRSFGWSMEMVVPRSALFLGLALAASAALLAGLYPALKVARTSPGTALREE